MKKFATALTLTLAILPVLAGCGRARFPAYYTLSLPPAPDPAAQESVRSSIAVREFRSPSYLRQGPIVYRPSAVLPSLLHQDPRYFYQGTGTAKSRFLHAMATPFVTRVDDGRREINYSNIIGDLASGAIAKAYYPSQDRGAGLVARSALVGIGSRMALCILQEFVLRNWTSRHSSQP